jgi:hypothetical protein
MLRVFLHETFDRLRAGPLAGNKAPELGSGCMKGIDQIAELVIDQMENRLRAVPGSVRRLRGPIAHTMQYIDGLVEAVPGVLRCARSTFTADPRVNAFFVDHNHLQEVFSQSKEVRVLFDEHPDLEECFGLLCMHGEERTQLGMELVDDVVRKDVLQTTLSFTDHQIFSPGGSEADARCALKCCIFKSLIDYAQKRSLKIETEAYELENRHRALRARLKRLDLHPSSGGDRGDLQRRLQAVEEQLQGQGPRLVTLEDRLRYLIDVFSHPEQVLRGQQRSVFLSRMGVKHNQLDNGISELPLSEIQLGCQRARVASLVSFCRVDLLPQRDFLKEASAFLPA